MIHDTRILSCTGCGLPAPPTALPSHPHIPKTLIRCGWWYWESLEGWAKRNPHHATAYFEVLAADHRRSIA